MRRRVKKSGEVTLNERRKNLGVFNIILTVSPFGLKFFKMGKKLLDILIFMDFRSLSLNIALFFCIRSL